MSGVPKSHANTSVVRVVLVGRLRRRGDTHEHVQFEPFLKQLYTRIHRATGEGGTGTVEQEPGKTNAIEVVRRAPQTRLYT